jgi:predicted O-methyltransferase YrrM
MRPTNKGLIDLIQLLPNNCSMVEIGCYRGESTEIFLSSGKIRSLIAIDPWINGYDKKDAASKRVHMSIIEEDFKNRISKFKDIVRVLKTSSVDAFNLIKKERLKFDFVYIDGNHNYDYVFEDIYNWSKLIRKRGLIGGHDYGSDSWKGVKQAVDELLGKPDYTFSDLSWIKKL